MWIGMRTVICMGICIGMGTITQLMRIDMRMDVHVIICRGTCTGVYTTACIDILTAMCAVTAQALHRQFPCSRSHYIQSPYNLSLHRHCMSTVHPLLGHGATCLVSWRPGCAICASAGSNRRRCRAGAMVWEASSTTDSEAMVAPQAALAIHKGEGSFAFLHRVLLYVLDMCRGLGIGMRTDTCMDICELACV